MCFDVILKNPARYEIKKISNEEWEKMEALFIPKKRPRRPGISLKAVQKFRLASIHNRPIGFNELRWVGYPDPVRNTMNAKFKAAGLPYRVVSVALSFERNFNYYMIAVLKS